LKEKQNVFHFLLCDEQVWSKGSTVGGNWFNMGAERARQR
jgi:hypothetical protein